MIKLSLIIKDGKVVGNMRHRNLLYSEVCILSHELQKVQFQLVKIRAHDEEFKIEKV